MGDTPDIEIFENKILGKGAYGTVYLGKKKIKEPTTKNERPKTQIEESNTKNAESKSTITESNSTISVFTAIKESKTKNADLKNNPESKSKKPEAKKEVGESKDKVAETGIKIALKEIPPEIDNDQDAKNSLSNEIIVSSYLDNTNIVRMIDIVYKNNKRYLAYEYCNGGDLRFYMNYFEKFDEELIQIIIIKMVHALFELHKKRVVHHDIKPENILIQLYPSIEETKELENEIGKLKTKIKLKKKRHFNLKNQKNQNNQNKMPFQNNNCTYPSYQNNNNFNLCYQNNNNNLSYQNNYNNLNYQNNNNNLSYQNNYNNLNFQNNYNNLNYQNNNNLSYQNNNNNLIKIIILI